MTMNDYNQCSVCLDSIVEKLHDVNNPSLELQLQYAYANYTEKYGNVVVGAALDGDVHGSRPPVLTNGSCGNRRAVDFFGEKACCN